MKKIRFVWRYVRPYRYQFVLILLDVAIYSLFMLAAPLIISWMIDNIIKGVPFENAFLQQLVDMAGGMQALQSHLWIGSVLVVVSYLMVAFAINRRSMHAGNVAETLALNVRNDLYDHLQKLPFSYHKSRDSGDLIQRSTSDIETVRRFLANQFSEMLFAMLNVTLAALILFSRSVKLTLVSIALIPLILIASYVFFSKAKKIFLECDLAESSMTTVLQENLNAMRVVKAFHQEQHEIDKFEEANDAYRKKYFDLMHALALFWSGTDFLGQMQILVMIIFGIGMALQGELSVGTFFVFLMYESTIVWPLRQLGRILSDLGKVSVSITRIEEVLNEEAEDLESGLRPDISGNIRFDHVSFRYEDGSRHTLHDLSFTIHEGERIAIMGPTGSGKSSLVHLLSGIYDYDQGSITINGVELRNIAKSWLRRHVQIVLQEPFLFSKTIYENIHLSDHHAMKEDVVEAARMSCIHNDIEDFDQGYETMVGEKGVTLSGGQKQRVAIARSLLAKSPIMVFDDSLSALDMKTDAMIQEALQDIRYSMTMLMITHRVASAQNADRILVLEHGRLVQEGTHEELIKQDGLYRRIYEIQKEGGEAYGTAHHEGTGV